MGSINNLIIDPVNAAPDHVSDAGQVNQQLARLVETGRGVILAQWTARGCTLAGSGPMANRLLAVDASLRDAWQDFSNDEFDQIVGLGLRDTGVPVGAGRAVVAGADGVVRDDSWVEVFEAADGVVAIVQAADPD